MGPTGPISPRPARLPGARSGAAGDGNAPGAAVPARRGPPRWARRPRAPPRSLLAALRRTRCPVCPARPDYLSGRPWEREKSFDVDDFTSRRGKGRRRQPPEPRGVARGRRGAWAAPRAGENDEASPALDTPRDELLGRLTSTRPGVEHAPRIEGEFTLHSVRPPHGERCDTLEVGMLVPVFDPIFSDIMLNEISFLEHVFFILLRQGPQSSDCLPRLSGPQVVCTGAVRVWVVGCKSRLPQAMRLALGRPSLSG